MDNQKGWLRKACQHREVYPNGNFWISQGGRPTQHSFCTMRMRKCAIDYRTAFSFPHLKDHGESWRFTCLVQAESLPCYKAERCRLYLERKRTPSPEGHVLESSYYVTKQALFKVDLKEVKIFDLVWVPINHITSRIGPLNLNTLV